MGVTGADAAGPKELIERLQSAFPGAEARASGGRDPDPLVQALIAVASHYGIASDPLSLVSGLPLANGRLGRAHVAEAADRLGLVMEELEGSGRGLTSARCPAIAVGRSGEAWVVQSVAADGAFLLVKPGSTSPPLVCSRAARKQDRMALLAFRPQSPAWRHDRADPDQLLSRRAVLGNRALYGQAIVATVALNLLALAVPLFTMNVYDRVLPNNAQSTLWALGIGAMIAILFEFVIRTLRASLIDVASRRADLVLSMRVFSRLLGAKLAVQPPSVGVQANTLREIETIRDFNTSVTLTALGDLPFALLFLGMIAVIGGPLVLVPLVAAPLAIALVFVLQIPLERLHATTFRQMAQKTAVLVETLTGLETLKASAAESWAAGKWEHAVADQLRLSTVMRFLAGLGMSLVSLTTALTTIVMVMLGVGYVADGTITAGGLIASMMLLSRAMGPLAQIAALAGRMHSVKLARQALKAVVEAPQERPVAQALIARPSLDGAIAFEDVTFRYGPDAAPALHSVSFRIGPGEHVGILGVIGSGKSTLLKLITKLYEPDQGRIVVDGLALSGLDPAALRHRIAYLGQDGVLFRGSIRENILLHCPGASDAELLAAAEAAGAMAWITQLPLGFDTQLGERGQGLSGGQRRSLALARALAGAPPVILLDEPTSEMDGRTEQIIIERLRTFSAGRTMLLVTHKHTLLPLVDRLIIMDRGRVHLDGSKAEVLEKLVRQNTGRRSEEPAVKAGGV
jgi:ATP-binding cassette subfamily C protein LapB